MCPELLWFPNSIILRSKNDWNETGGLSAFPKFIFYYHKNGGFFATSFLQLGKKFRKPTHMMPKKKKKKDYEIASQWAAGEMPESWFIPLREIGDRNNIHPI